MTKKLNLLFLAAIFIFLFLGVNAAFAYTLSGIIYGGSNPLPDATVTLYDAGTGNQLQSTVTNSGGFYSFTIDNGTTRYQWAEGHITTQATPDLTGPVFTTAPFVSGVSKTQAVIEWDTDEPSTTQIKYGTSSDQLNYQTALPGLANAHAIILTNLNPGTTYYFRAMSMDSSGNLSESSVGQFATETPDTTPPSGTITINSGANYTNSTLVTLTLSCSDASGCAHMQFSNDNTVWSPPEDYQTSKMWTLSSGDGTKTVYVKFQDGAGNWSGAFSDSITLQTVAPITTASPAGGTYTSAQSVTLTANKSATIYYTKDGSTPTTSSPVYSSPISITATTTLKFALPPV